MADHRKRDSTVSFLTASGAADRIPGAKPKDISDLFYQRKIDISRCPVVAGRRLIPPDLVAEIAAALRLGDGCQPRPWVPQHPTPGWRPIRAHPRAS